MIPFKDDNPKTRFPIITLLLIILNIVVYIYQILLGKAGDWYVYNYGAIPYEIVRFSNLPFSDARSPAISLITCMFLHGSLFHLLGNMLYLWIFGDNVEDRFGRVNFLIFYLLCGLMGTFAHTMFNIHSTTPLIGASGAISGVLGAYLILFPRASVHLLVIIIFFIRVIKLPALLVLGFWFIIQLLNAIPSLSYSGGGVAWFAHVGGFVSGMLFLLLFDHGKK